VAPVLRRGVAVLSAVVAIFLLVELRRVVAGLVVAGFFAAVLAPAVEVFERRVQLWRGLAVGVVVTLTTLVVLGVIVAICGAAGPSGIEAGDQLLRLRE
jgi:predicted PurR-regulated permease PerM